MKSAKPSESRMDNQNLYDLSAELTAEIVSAYVANNPISASHLPDLIGQVSEALNAASRNVSPKPNGNKTPAVPIKKSVQDDYIICLEDGLRFRTLKRHLRSKYDLSPEEYRAKWNLSADYPMVARSYANKRSQLAKELGLGRKPGSKTKKRKS